MRRIFKTETLLALFKALLACEKDIENFKPTNLYETVLKETMNNKARHIIETVVEKACKQLDEDGF